MKILNNISKPRKEDILEAGTLLKYKDQLALVISDNDKIEDDDNGVSYEYFGLIYLFEGITVGRHNDLTNRDEFFERYPLKNFDFLPNNYGLKIN